MSSRKTKEKFVVTIKGEELPISKCRKYESGFYKIGDINVESSGDCYLMENGSYYRSETGQIMYDHFNKKYVQNNAVSGLLYGFINDKLELGYFQKNINCVKVHSYEGVNNAMNSEIFLKNYQFREKISDGAYYHISLMKALDFNKKIEPSQEYKYSLPYDSKDIIKNYTENYDNFYKPSIELNNEKDILKIIKNLSFGLEFESVRGQIPKNICNRLGLIPLRDGSIEGLEYVTIPLQGSKGVCTIYDVVKELKYRTDYNHTCSFHLHLGNVPRTASFITAFTKLTLGVQDEIFSMFNLYKKYNFRYKNKNYSAPFNTFKMLSKLDKSINSKNLIENFDTIFTYLSEGYTLASFGDKGDLSQIHHHPKDPNGNQKWNVNTRYHIHNMIPLIFGNKQTIEFRIHTPTYNIDKIIAFLLLNSVLINYTINNEKQILEGTRDSFNISDILYEYASKEKISGTFIDKLIKYFNNRKVSVEQHNQASNIYFQEEQIPCSFKFNIENISKSTSLFGIDPSSQFNKFTITDFSNEIFQYNTKSRSKIISEKNVLGNREGVYESYYKQLKKDESGLGLSEAVKLEPVEPLNQSYVIGAEDFYAEEYLEQNYLETSDGELP
jgi:hypothetical protein